MTKREDEINGLDQANFIRSSFIEDYLAEHRAINKSIKEKKKDKEVTRKKKGRKKRKKNKTLLGMEKKYNDNLRASVGLIYDRLIACPKLFLLKIDLQIPTLDDVVKRLKAVNLFPNPLLALRLQQAADSNIVINRFREELVRVFNKEDADWYFGTNKKVHYNNMGFIWCREYGKKKKKRHYHCLLLINGNRTFKVGSYDGFPFSGNYFVNRVAQCYLKALHLDELEFAYAGSMKMKERLFGGYIRYPGKKLFGVTKEDYDETQYDTKSLPYAFNYYKSTVIGRKLEKESIRWLHNRLDYMLKMVTKTIPDSEKAFVNEREKSFGRSELVFTGLEGNGIAEKAKRFITKRKKELGITVNKRNVY